MGLMYDYLSKHNILNEVEVDGQTVDGEKPNTLTDYTDDGSQAQQDTNNANDAEMTPSPDEAQPQNDDNNGPPEQYEKEPTDYTQMGNDEAEGGSDYNENSEGGSTQEEEQPIDDIKAKEEEIYANLTPEQLDIKHKELKNRFLDMFDITTELIDRIGNIAVNEDNIATIEYISNTLSKLRTMISDYVDSVYQIKSYIENSINYNRFLAVLNGINKMLEEIHEKED